MIKDKRINIRLNEDDKNKIFKKANESNMNLSNYLIKCGLNKKIIVINDLKTFNTELRRIGNNINQLTKLCNEGKITCLELSNVRKEVCEMWRLLNLLIQNQH